MSESVLDDESPRSLKPVDKAFLGVISPNVRGQVYLFIFLNFWGFFFKQNINELCTGWFAVGSMYVIQDVF